MNKNNAKYYEVAYSTYCETVGGLAWNGDVLPTWDELCRDENKERIVHAWQNAVDAVIEEWESIEEWDEIPGRCEHGNR